MAAPHNDNDELTSFHTRSAILTVNRTRHCSQYLPLSYHMSLQSYLKQPFVWGQPKPPIHVPERLDYKAITTLDKEVFRSLVAQVVEHSLDSSDRKQVSEHGAAQAAEKFIAESKDGFFYRDEWWKVGLDSSGKIVGFVLPVIYQGCARDGLEEATLYYIGVLPEYRQRGFGVDLLLAGTKILQDIGVWRVFCDTDVNNTPMISTFEKVGYRRYSDPYQRPL